MTTWDIDDDAVSRLREESRPFLEEDLSGHGQGLADSLSSAVTASGGLSTGGQESGLVAVALSLFAEHAAERMEAIYQHHEICWGGATAATNYYVQGDLAMAAAAQRAAVEGREWDPQADRENQQAGPR